MFSRCFTAIIQCFLQILQSRISVEALTRPGSGAKKEIDCEE
jgi:hypothetical protein